MRKMDFCESHKTHSKLLPWQFQNAKCETHFGFKLLLMVIVAAFTAADVVFELINTPITCDSFRFASDTNTYTCTHPLGKDQEQDLIAPHPVTVTVSVPFPQPTNHRTLNPKPKPKPKPPLKVSNVKTSCALI